jgi:glutathione synthase/RimK-type ligase-like ATP-grasp enzyme
MKRLFPSEYYFDPITFFLPEETFELKNYMKYHPNEYFIAKPSSGTQGNGISLVNSYAEVKKASLHSFDELVVQKYISKPLLINK